MIIYTEGKRNISTQKMENLQSRSENNACNEKAWLLKNQEHNNYSIRIRICK